MYTKKYYEMKIAECEYQIEGNNKLKNKLIDKLGVIGSRKNNEEEYIDTLLEVLSSWIIEKIDNYNSSMYYESPEYMYACYEEGKVL